MICRVIQHVCFEDLGSWKDILVRRGYDIVRHQAGIDLPGEEEWREADLGIVLGGPVGVYDTELFPWLEEERRLLAGRIAARGPLLGVCLGAQLAASALGAAVYPSGGKEIGWGTIRLTAEGERSCLRHLRDVPVLHWHGDTFDLPPGAELLASTDKTQRQAFLLGSRLLAVQFHPEAETEELERWLIGHACELAAAGADPRRIRADGRRFGGLLRPRAAKVLEEWLDGLGVAVQ
ncbi:MAG: glutamine amidotransferase [Desulfovibrio sp.]|jgi:GMP synthase (glutamine-hydrolysing)|nr:glutamine amidotransferase [Desulfovibrio sp.]